ncbi:hypothetical protein ANCCAN_19642 [Ancylostoma caninum]|uniref:Uncharacterized protein n=1 Tax=Ancylostoma caninum TaxID=29170 RepID=A0A368FU35_ANCCA|nr:hypothetical protein ANCCAN_19642 [Ancylostoma caninum]
MTDQLDFYDCVNARKYGSLGNDDGVTEMMCDEFFNTHRDASERTLLQDALASSQNGPVDNAADKERHVQDNSVEVVEVKEVNEGPTVVQKEEGPSRNEVGEVVQDENRPEIKENIPEVTENRPEASAVSKAAENLEDLGRLAMFGKQRTVLRRSQIREPPRTAPSPVPNVSATQARNRGTPRTVPNRATTPTPGAHARLARPQPTSGTTTAPNGGSIKPGPVRVTPAPQPRTGERRSFQGPVANVGRSPIIRAVRTPRPAAQTPVGPITRARSKELNSRNEQENAGNTRSVATKAQGSTTEVVSVRSFENIRVKSIENRFRQLRLGTERSSRNRAPRTTTSSRPTGVTRPTYPVRIGHERQQCGADFLRNDTVPSAREFHRELLHRKASLGSCHRSSSTPKDAQKQPSGGGATATASNRPTASQAAGVTSSRLPMARSSSVTRPSREVVNRPVPRAASATRAPVGPRPLSAASRPMARSDSITRIPARPPSVTRPQIPNSTLERRGISSSGALTGSARAPVGRRPVAITATARNTTTARATPLQTKPTEPRSSVIRNPPSKKGPGDGTPLRGFRSELRQYPAPSV